MQPEHLSQRQDSGLTPANDQAVSERIARTGRKARLTAIERSPPADFRDQCGLKWQFSCRSWPLIVRLLLWATRHNDG